MRKIKHSKEGRGAKKMRKVVILDTVVREGSLVMTFKPNPEGNEKTSHSNTWGKNVLERTAHAKAWSVCRYPWG